ncbi:hypothetical protein AB0F81_06695 [Actinoplanes sp. NPDC024001]|uniref:hypothetical protein n=1 Tax=Actinoplanes sp. NPDC024001 TaxID=3154598 RepID=UPI00340A646C
MLSRLRTSKSIALAALATAIGLTGTAVPATAAAAPLPSDTRTPSTPAVDPTGKFIVARGLDGSILFSRGTPFTNSHADFVSIGQQVVGDPTAVAGLEGTHVFARDTANQAITAFAPLGNTPSRFEVIPGLLISSEIAAVTIPQRGSNAPQVRVFARGLDDGALYTNLLIQGAPQGWVNLGGFLTSEISAALTGPLDFTVNIRLAARGSDSRIHSMVFNNTTGVVSPWTAVGDLVAFGNPTLSKNGGMPDLRGNEIFVRRAPDRALFTWNFDNPGWVNLGGVCTSDVSVSVSSDNGLQLHVSGTTGNVYLNRRPPGSTRFGGFVNLRGIATGNPVATGGAPQFGRTVADQVFVRGTDNRLYGRIQLNFVGGFDPYVALNGPPLG